MSDASQINDRGETALGRFITQHQTDDPLLTQKGMCEFLNAQGYPISENTLSLLCLPSRNLGPPREMMWGRRPLYRASKTLAWAKARCRPPQAA